MLKLFSLSYARWLIFLPIAMLCSFLAGTIWEYIFKGLVYVFWPSTSRSIGPDDINFFNSATASNTFAVLKFLSRVIISMIVYFYSGLFFFDKNEKSKPLKILALFYISLWIVVITGIANIGESRYLILNIIVIFCILIYYRFLRAQHISSSDSKIKTLTTKLLEIGWFSSIIYKTKKIAYYLFEKIGMVLLVVYVVVAHIYFFVVLYGYWQKNGFDNILTTGVIYSLWKAVFWMFYIW